jgi:hypothetical protein
MVMLRANIAKIREKPNSRSWRTKGMISGKRQRDRRGSDEDPAVLGEATAADEHVSLNEDVVRNRTVLPDVRKTTGGLGRLHEIPALRRLR